MEMLQGVWKQDLRPRAVVGYGVKIFLSSPPNYVTRSPGRDKKRFGYRYVSYLHSVRRHVDILAHSGTRRILGD